MRFRVATVLIALTLVTSGCGLRANEPVPPGARPPSSLPSPSDEPGPSRSARRPAAPATTRPAVPTGRTSTGPGEQVAVTCGGRPSGAQVLTLLRRGGVLPASVDATVTTGPLCAGTWQYTLITVPTRGELHVVTKGPPAALALVTAGTNPCTVQVRAEAPRGILTVLRCDA